MKMLVDYAIGGNFGHFDNEIDCAGSESLEGMKVVQIMLSEDLFVFPVGRHLQVYKNDVYLLPMKLTEKAVKIHHPAHGRALNVPTQIKQIFRALRCRVLATLREFSPTTTSLV